MELPANHTGGDLVVDDPGLFGRIFREKRTDVPGLLASELKEQLGQRGFTVVNDGRKDVPVLRSQIRRWEPYSADYSIVRVDVAASLVDAATGRQIWTLERADWQVPTRDADSRGDASARAIEVVAAPLLDGWKPGSTTPDP